MHLKIRLYTGAASKKAALTGNNFWVAMGPPGAVNISINFLIAWG